MATAEKEAEAVADETPEEPEGLDLAPPEDGEPDAPEVPEYVAPKPTAKQKKTADKVYDTLKGQDIIGADAAVSAMLQLIDVHPSFTPPEEWPGSESDEYYKSSQLAAMSELLCKGCPKLTVKPKGVIFLWRNKEKWTSAGKTVRGNVAKLNTRVRYLQKGKRAVVEINYHHFRTLNPLQRTFALYHELRQLTEDGSIQPAEFSGFYDEMEVFGPRVFREMMELARVVEVGSRVEHEHQLPLFPDA